MKGRGKASSSEVSPLAENSIPCTMNEINKIVVSIEEI
jgi:hypothetical protein